MKNSTEIICILDRSGSMQSIANDAIGGYNAFIKAQQAVEGECTLTLVLFDNVIEKVLSGVDIRKAAMLDSHTFVPRGSTSLYEAIIKTVVGTGVRLAALPEESRPEKVLVVILTDGQENSSGPEYTQDRVASLIKQQEDQYSWTFTFLAANQNAFAAAASMNIAYANTMNFAATGQGVSAVMDNLSVGTASYRTSSARSRKDLFADVKTDKQGNVTKS